MKRSTVLLVIFLLSKSLFAQKSDQEISKLVKEKDSIFWVGYNTCNLDLMAQFLTKDMEFYHDEGGIILGIDGMKKSMSENICNNSNNKVRRELVPGTFQLFLLKNGDTVYGAIISGEHYFYDSENGGKETRNGVARFTNLWLLKDGEWKMHRILSFDHKSL